MTIGEMKQLQQERHIPDEAELAMISEELILPTGKKEKCVVINERDYTVLLMDIS